MDTLWFPTSTQHVKRWIEKRLAESGSREDWYFVIETLEGETVGMIHTHDCHVHDRRFSYGVGVRQAFRRKGYATAAIQLVLKYYFRHKGYQRAEIEVFAFNPSSARLHERLGFQLEGTRRAAKWHDGAFYDIWIYGLFYPSY